jgi:hypothetical protein
MDDVVGSVPTRQDVCDELDRVRTDFSALVARSDDKVLARLSSGTRWTNRQLLFHMLLGYLVTRNLRLIVKGVSRLPPAVQRAFAGGLDVTTRPFNVINYWGSVVGGRLLSPPRMDAWMGRVIPALKRDLQQESANALPSSMPFPVRWDPYFSRQMTLLSIYHYPTLHYDHHRAQLTLPG